jgi:hypothetical protein
VVANSAVSFAKEVEAVAKVRVSRTFAAKSDKPTKPK